MEEKTEKIVGIKILEPMVGGIGGPPFVFVTLESGNDIPLFQFDSEKMNYEPVQFIGLTYKEAVELKRIKDLVWFGAIFPSGVENV